MLPDSIYMKFKSSQNKYMILEVRIAVASRGQNTDCQGEWGKSNSGNVLYFDLSGVKRLPTYVKTYQVVHLRLVFLLHFALHMVYINK